jgi:hypothetical protein
MDNGKFATKNEYNNNSNALNLRNDALSTARPEIVREE